MRPWQRLCLTAALAVFAFLSVTWTAEARPNNVKKTFWKTQHDVRGDATKLRFKVWQQEDDINIIQNSWQVVVTGAAVANISIARADQPDWPPRRGHRASPHRTLKTTGNPAGCVADNGMHALDVVVTFAAPGVPRGKKIKVTTTLRLTSWNTLRIWKPTFAARDGDGEGDPSFGWFLEPPEVVPGRPDQWSHRFVLADDGPVPEFHVDSYLAYDDGTPPDYSWWCGTLHESLAGGDGYGNNWDERLDLPPVDWTGYVYPIIDFRFRNDTEPGHDFSYVDAVSDTLFVHLNSGFDGVHPWSTAAYPLVDMDNPAICRFRFISDAAGSDDDGLYDSNGGAFHVDEITVYDCFTGDVLFYDTVENRSSPCLPSNELAAPVSLRNVRTAVSTEPLLGDSLDWFSAWDDTLLDAFLASPGGSLALSVLGPAAASPTDSIHVYAYYELWNAIGPGGIATPFFHAWLDHYDWLEQSTAVEGAFYTVATEATVVTLQWTVVIADDIVGFNVYRSTSPDGPFARINEGVLPATPLGEYEDSTVWPETTFWYQLRAVHSNGSEDLVGETLAPATTGGTLVARLYPAEPNPFTSSTYLCFDVPDRAGPVTLAVYDVAGRTVRTLAARPLDRGRHIIEWNGVDDAGHSVSSGVYFVRYEASGLTKTQKVTLTR